MRVLMLFLRFIFGLTFIISGFFKLVDPVGTGLIIKEYLGLMHLGFLSFGAVYIGMAQSILELLIGIAIFMRMRMKIASLLGLILTGVFTLITLFLAIFNPIQDCGCFGEVIHLTNWQTFFKNLILLACIVPIFLYRNKFRRVAPIAAEWSFLNVYAVLALIVTVMSYLRMPAVDLGNFKTGTNIFVKLDEAAQDLKLETVFIYSKDGRQKEFGLDNLPDSTWTFVKSVDISKKSSERAPFDFSVYDAGGNYFTEELLVSQTPVILSIITDFDKYSSDKRWNKVISIADAVEEGGGEFIILTSAAPSHVEETLAPYIEAFPIHIGYSDYKTLISMQRSNGGYIYMDDAQIIKKWYNNGLSPKEASEVISKDSEMVMSRDIIKRQLIYEISIVAIFLTIVLMRYIFSLVYGRKQKFFV